MNCIDRLLNLAGRHAGIENENVWSEVRRPGATLAISLRDRCRTQQCTEHEREDQPHTFTRPVKLNIGAACAGYFSTPVITTPWTKTFCASMNNTIGTANAIMAVAWMSCGWVLY